VPGAFEACSNGQCLSYSTWGKHIDDKINGQAVGYAYRVVRDGALTNGYNAFGHARTAADPPVTAMSVKEPYNIASVSKTLTAVAVLHLLAAEQVSVNSAIAPYLPPRWQLGQGVSAITFAELLTHTSGIQVDGIRYSELKAIVSQNIDLSPQGYKASCKQDYQRRLQGRQGVLCYQNANFALFRIIIPYLWHENNPYYPSLLSLLNLPPDQYDNALDKLTADDYLSYMNSVYGPSLPISCTPQGSSRMLAYVYPGGGSGTDWRDWKPMCGAGGIQLSADQMATFLANLASGTYLPLKMVLSSGPDTTTLSTMVNSLYGWDWQYQTTTYGTCVQKNGLLVIADANNNRILNLTTLIVYCPQTGLAFAGLANSRLGPSLTSWDSIVETAYNESWQ
jgi:CubicO group peptidase (beta-lactamase class C family)